MSETLTEERARCTAKSKQSGERCKRPPHPGERVCIIHGGRGAKAKREQPSNRLDHGMRSKFIPVADLDKVAVVASALAGVDGRKAHLLRNTAVEAVRVEKLDEADNENLIRYHDSQRRNLETVGKIEESARAAITAPTAFTITLPDFAHGPVTVRGPQGTPVAALKDPEHEGSYLLKADDGAWRQARKVERDGIELYELPIALESHDQA